jgi:hypothetical protein
MKNIPNLLGKVILVYLLSNLIITIGFVISHHPDIDYDSLKHILIHYSLALSIPPAVAFLVIHLIYSWIKTRWVFYLTAFLILCATFFSMYLILGRILINELADGLNELIPAAKDLAKGLVDCIGPKR